MYSIDNLNRQAASQKAVGSIGSGSSVNISVDHTSTTAQNSANARTQSSSQVLDPAEELAIRRKQTEPVASLQLRSADLLLEQRPTLSNGDQIFEHFSQGNLNDLTFQYSNPMGSEDASAPFGNVSQNYSQANNCNASLDGLANSKRLHLMGIDRHMVSEEKLPMSGDGHLLHQSASNQNVVHTSRGINMNIEHYQARRKAKMSKYNSLLGNQEQHSIGNSASANILSYHNDGGHKMDFSLNTNESTPIGSTLKAGEPIGERPRLSLSGDEKMTPTQGPEPFTPSTDGKLGSNLTTNS